MILRRELVAQCISRRLILLALDVDDIASLTNDE